MKYPKPIMKTRELVALGFQEDWLLYAYRKSDRNKPIAWKKNPMASNSTIYYDTEELEKFRKSQCGI